MIRWGGRGRKPPATSISSCVQCWGLGMLSTGSAFLAPPGSFIFRYVAPAAPTCLFSSSLCDLRPQALKSRPTSSLHTLSLYVLSCCTSQTPLTRTGAITGPLGLLGQRWTSQLVHKRPRNSVWRIPFTWLISPAHQTYTYTTGCPNPTLSGVFWLESSLAH